jgi:hypothetical protein
MDNFAILVAQFDDETCIQEFSLPLNQEKVEIWASMQNISFLEINSEISALFTEKRFTVENTKLSYFDIKALHCYLLTGVVVDKKVDLVAVTTLAKITEKTFDEAMAWLEIFPGLEVSCL